MEATLLAIRSIGAEFANRIYFPVALVSAIVLGGLLWLTAWFSTSNSWWWLLFILLMVVASIAIGVLGVAKLIIRSMTPYQTKAQRQQVKTFVDKLQRLSDVAGTPKIILMFRIIRDIAAPRADGLIATMSHDTASLTRDFTALCAAFKRGSKSSFTQK